MGIFKRAPVKAVSKASSAELEGSSEALAVMREVGGETDDAREAAAIRLNTVHHANIAMGHVVESAISAEFVDSEFDAMTQDTLADVGANEFTNDMLEQQQGLQLDLARQAAARAQDMNDVGA